MRKISNFKVQISDVWGLVFGISLNFVVCGLNFNSVGVV